MKKVIIIVVLLISTWSFAQTTVVNNYSYGVGQGNVSIMENTHVGSWVTSKLIDNGIEGSEYIYKSWNYKAIVTANDGKQYAVPFMNFNARNNNFAANISSKSNGVHRVVQDSVYVFNNVNISKVNINRKDFVKVVNEVVKTPKFFELVYGDGNFRLLKLYEASIKEAPFNPMTQQKTGKDKMVIKTKYFLETENFKEVKLKNKTIINLLGDKKSEVAKFMKTNKLSAKNENHLMRVFNYYKSL